MTIKYCKIKVHGPNSRSVFECRDFHKPTASFCRHITDTHKLVLTSYDIVTVKKMSLIQQWRNSKSYDMYHKSRR